MKRIFTLLLASVACISSSVFAQCDPNFDFTVNAFSGTVQFLPVSTAAVEHTWVFGDGTATTEIAPSHVYAPGTYNVVHVVVFRTGVDSIVQCIDSAVRTVTVPGVPACNLQASFFFSRDSSQTNRIYFVNTSSGGSANNTYFWDFGDGSGSYEINPVHIFSVSGLFTVCLYVRNGNNCSDSFCSVVQVQAPPSPCDLVVNFRDTLTGINTIHFTNLSTPLSATDSVTWYFGDGAISHDITGATHVYANSGTYNVCLIVKKNGNTGGAVCVREYCRQITIPNANCNLVPGFVFFRDSTTNPTFPGTYVFVNTSTPLTLADSSFWDFGDGSPVVINPNNPVSHIYAPGVYTACLLVKKVQPGTINVICERQVCQTILVDTPQVVCNLQAYFSYQADSAVYNKIYFTNQTVPFTASDSIRWTFGDGSSSTDINPIHTYNTAGTYTVCLRVKRQQIPPAAPCISEYCKTIVIQQPNTCNLVANFIDSSINNNTVYFINQSTPLAAGDSIRWTFGDGSSSTDINGLHTYTQPGTYNVCLRVKKVQTNSSAPCVREICHVIVIQPNTACNLVVNYEYSNDSISGAPNVFHFFNTSTGLSSADSSFWDFGDNTPVVVNSNTPVTHTYATQGSYVVCLTVKKMVPGTTTVLCERQMCQFIWVSGPASPCDQLHLNFTWAADSSNRNKIHFLNQSTPVTANTFSEWSFGDGDSSMSYSPTHVYAQPGTYTVCLRMHLGNACVKDSCTTIVVLPGVTDSCNFHPSYITHIDSANHRRVLFTNTTIDPSSIMVAVWNFGDGTTATGWNAAHTYTMPGWYMVCLTVIRSNNTACSRTYCDSVFVPGNVIPPYNCDSFQLSFGYHPDSYMPNKLYFFATGNAPVYNQQWSFTNTATGNTVNINQFNPVYVFPDTGLYRVCVRGAFSTGCIKEYCDDVRISSTSTPSQCILNAYPNPAHNYVTFNVQLDQAGIITSTIYNAQGVALTQYTQTGATGNNAVTLNIQNLVPGFYNVRIMYNGRVCYTRFQKI